METTVVADPAAAGVLVAGLVVDRLAEAPCGRPFLLGCPAGRTPAEAYRQLPRLAAARGVPLDDLVVVMVDEYLAPGTDELCDPAAHFSCRRFIAEHLAGVARSQVWQPDPADPAAYDQRIADAGGISLFLLASGASDGHVAFNPPGTPADSPTRIVRLADSTRRDNLRTFPAFASVDEVPTHGVSIGLRSIAAAAEVVLLLLGAEKATSRQRIADADGFDPAWPATILHACRRPQLVLDAAAAAG